MNNPYKVGKQGNVIHSTANLLSKGCLNMFYWKCIECSIDIKVLKSHNGSLAGSWSLTSSYELT